MAAAAAVAVLAACATPAVRYYTLAGVPPGSGTEAAGTAASARPAQERLYVEVGPVGVPERLARPQMVVRSETDPASTRVDVLEQQRWSAPFDRELRDAFAVAIAARLGAVDVTHGGQLPGRPVYHVSIQLRRFDATPGARVDAVYGWTVSRSDDGRNTLCQALATQAVGAGMDALVHGIQRTVAFAAERIAAGIAQLEETGRAGCAAAETPDRSQGSQRRENSAQRAGH